MKLRVTILSLLFGAIACLIADQYVYKDVEKLRFKLLPRPSPPANNGIAALQYVNPRPEDARILAMRIKNNSDKKQAFIVRQNGNGIATFTVEKDETLKYLSPIPEMAKCSQCRLTIVGKNADWQLQTVEVRNIFGFSSVWLKAVLIEPTFHNYTKFKLLHLASNISRYSIDIDSVIFYQLFKEVIDSCGCCDAHFFRSFCYSVYQ